MCSVDRGRAHEDYPPKMTTAAYAPPQANLEMHTGFDADRQRMISHEQAIRQVGSLYFLGSSVMATSAFGMLAVSVINAEFGLVLMTVLLAGVAAIGFWVGRGLRRLDASVRGVAGLFSGLGLLNFPVGTLIHGYILYLLFSQKGSHVFSSEYREVIDNTPHIKCGTSPVVVVLALLLLVALLGILIAVLLG